MNKREKKRDSLRTVAALTHLDIDVLRRFEANRLEVLEFTAWMMLASYYGREALQVPFTLYKVEFQIAEEYFMYLRNGESIQYSAKKAFEKLYGGIDG